MQTKFVFLILPEMHLMDLAGPDQVILESIGAGADFIMEYCSPGEPSETSAGLPVGKLQHFSKVNLNKGDFLVVPGANTAFLLSEGFRKEKILFDWIRSAHYKGVRVCSICTGAFVLALCGLLDNIPSTTHFKKTNQLQKLFPLTSVADNILFTSQDGIYTSAGIASGIDMMLYIVEQLKGSYFSHLVARELVVYNRRNGNQKQLSEMLEFRNHIHQGIHKVQDWLHENLHEKSSLEDLAFIANMSARNFTRVFKKETGITLNEYLNVIRKEKINELMKNPDLSREKIAARCGLRSTRQLSRILSKN